MKKVIAYFIKYPVAVNIIIIAFVILGFFGYSTLKSSFFPLTNAKFININVAYPGASPQEIEEGVVLKIEDNLKGLVGVDRVTSTSSENAATISVETLKGYDINVVLADVKNAVDKVPNFPTGMEPAVVAKIENIAETISFVVTGDDISLKSLKNIAREIENDIRRIDGISQISISGYPEEEIEIAVRENDLLAYELTFNQVANAVSTANILTTGGSVKTDAEEYLIRANNRSYYGDELDNLVVKADASGRIIRLKDVATVRDIWNETPNRNFYNGNLAVRMQVSNTNSEDLLTSAEKINEYIEKFNAEHDNVKIEVTRDSSITLNQRTELLFKNAWQGMLLVMLFLSLFLRPRLAFWVAAGLPVAFFGMFMLAGYFNITINVLSLFGMIIVIGILVDDGIVISENIYHHYEKGKNPIRAAIDGTMEVVPPIISAISTTVLAFSLFFFLDGNIGEFFGEVATVVALTLILSLVEALIILPAHVAHSKALDRNQKLYKFNKYAEDLMDFMRDKLYAPALKFVLENKFFGLTIPVALLMLTMGAFEGGIIKGTFFPSIASDRVSVNLTMPQGTNEKITDSIISVIEAKTWEVEKEFTKKYGVEGEPVVENILKQIGPGTAKASLRINLLPGETRSFSSREITNAIREKVGEVYGVETLTFGSGGNFGGSPVSVSLLSNNIAELKAAKTELKEELKKNQDLKDVTDNDPQGIKEIKIQLKENAYLLGLNLNEVMSQIRSGFFGRQAQRFQRGQDEIKVWVRYNKEERSSIKNLDDMRIVTPTGSRIPLSEIASYQIERGEISISHLDGQREIKVEADLKNAQGSATDILTDIQERIMPEISAKYPSVTALYEGQNREASKVSSSAAIVGPVILLLIYIVIVFTFRSYGQPFMLLIMVPFSLIGVAWGHWIHGFAVNILSLLGIIALIGIMVNDGLVLISKFNSYLKEGMEYEEALFAAGKSRFRAIFLTTITTVAGLAPLIFETSRQAQFLIPMAISIAYGIMIATFLTLLTLPILLSISNYSKVYTKWLWTGKRPNREEVERAIKELEAENEELEE
ncbi:MULTISPECIES: efflux RND transporter permease subunit [unclassified Tenacibaculum]|uniref:efflux RND transporter permease subunit n=1 Tax=unclassified Tenacibaculum TaxID=2635139 RepID=UPI001F38AA2B|nr:MULTISPECIES: efflux RND transporter permease subunit [unclassified Tenacibaculum]MCF2876354.1 efflux RND transporter permease subunit [Tenacibaculum sp. Cn5-1]MCF2936503.1 efflux RND transporter permease subunit [Tenacibaculum sp. Cn5-34]MCG7512772.1 efflux RND transporter permease subunit [Tenacibaculum sp. Cn5-46]